MIDSIGMVEFNSVAKGIYSADQMVKTSEVEIVTAMTACPGKYISIVHGDVAAVEDSVKAGIKTAEVFVLDWIVIPNVDPGVFPAITAATTPERIGAIGIIESFSIAAMIICADRVLKTADLEAIELRLGNGLGGKSYFIYTGDVAAVKSGMDIGRETIEEKGLLVNSEVIPAPSELLIPHIL